MDDFNGAIKQAVLALAEADPVLAGIIARHGACTLRPQKDYFRRLTESIVGQQLSVKAATAINTKFVAAFGGEFPEPAVIVSAPDDQLRAAGLSRAKVAYVKDLSEHVLSGRLELARMDGLSDDQIVAELTAVKGIGVWTAHMFLMFAIGRLDVLATGDLGVRNAVGEQYGFGRIATPAEVSEVATRNGWHPYETVACWYLWRSLDNAPA